MKSKHTLNDVDNNNTSTSQLSAQVLPVSSPTSQNTAASQDTTTSQNTTAPQNTTTTTTTSQMNESKHRDFLTASLDEWFIKNTSTYNFSNEKFVEGKDYKLTLMLTQTSEEAIISCACGTRINLSKERIHFSLSNYYKHIKTSKCTVAKNKRKIISHNSNNEDIVSTQQQTLDDDVVDISTTPKPNIDNNNKQPNSSSRKRIKSGSHDESSKKTQKR
ncbi:unnamed protein product [Adineta steineri]|uniref:Uncharacterized protein n=1 Tax=Adineta steineri TaxID=433720 RepID=A0A814EK50_9BILA|nr:unnamed protein product [Adineta steineri]CAF3908809.1 unnamed protein product [Adineta steineri]